MFIGTAEKGSGALHMDCQGRVEYNPIIRVHARGIQASDDLSSETCESARGTSAPLGHPKNWKRPRGVMDAVVSANLG